MIEFDSTRPCSSNSKDKNRYTRKELETVAKSHQIKDISKKTMNTLCDELRQKKSAVVPPPTEKPCGTKYAKKGGYSRKEVEELAKKHGIENIKKKNMDQLCEEIKKFSVSPKPKKVIVVKKTNIIKAVHKKDPNAFKPDYYFDEEKLLWVKLEGSPSIIYKASELRTMDRQTILLILNDEYQMQFTNDVRSDNELVNILLRYQYAKLLLAQKTKHLDISEVKKIAVILNPHKNTENDSQRSVYFNLILSPTKQHITPKEISELNTILGTMNNEDKNVILSPSTDLTVMQILYPKEFRFLKSSKQNKIVNKFSKKLLQFKTVKNLKSTKATDNLKFPYGEFTRDLSKRISYKKHSFNIRGYLNVPKNVADSDLTGLRNNNTWLNEQVAYQKKLPQMKQYVIFSYTFGGDQILHNWIKKKFNRNHFENNLYNTYMFKNHILPLIPTLNIMLKEKREHTTKTIVNCFPPNIKILVETFLIRVEDIEKDKNAYTDTIIWLNNNLHKADIRFYDVILKEYEIQLNKIIEEAPPLKHDFIVYKGVSDNNFLQFDKTTNYFTNKFFVSTSFDIKVANRFSTPTCCLLKITILKGTKCLFPIFTYYPKEHEIILPTKRKYYLTKDEYYPVNSKKKTQNVIVVN